MTRLRLYRADLLAILSCFLLALVWFAPVLFPSLTHATLLPYDNLYSFEPWRSLRPGLTPHNNLLSDLVLENAVWKLHIRRTLASGQLPLWNPQIFTGLPFLAAGQASTLYPLNLLFYVLPLEAAYGWFTALQIGLAGANMYVLGRVLRLRLLAALLSAVVFMFSGFLIVSVVFTMFLAAVVWLPLLLALIELIIRKQEKKGNRSFHPIPYVAAGIAAIGLMILAGHPELIYYTFLVSGAYALMRLLMAWHTLAKRSSGQPVWPRIAKLSAWLLVMAVGGVAAGGVQLLPLLELLPLNFRAGSVSYQQVVEWAWPTRHVLSFLLPDIFGNPSHHRWFDLWSRQWVPATVNALGQPNDTIFWGIKNYVEGGNYLGVATWLLAALAVLHTLYRTLPRWAGFRTSPGLHTASDLQDEQLPRIRNSTVLFFFCLAIVSLLFAFGTPLYALLFYGLPGWNQLHSPFRWVFPFTLSMAILAGIGLHIVLETGRWGTRGISRQLHPQWLGFAISLCVALGGALALGVVAASLLAPEPFINLGQRIVAGSDLVQTAFFDGRMFWSYQAANLVKLGIFALLSGLLVAWLIRLRTRSTGRPENKLAEACDPSAVDLIIPPSHRMLVLSLIALAALDLYAAHGRFNPATDPALSPLHPDNIPPVVAFLNEREGPADATAAQGTNPISPWRFTTFNLPGEKTFDANVGMYYGWQDIRGYDSVIPMQYTQFMERIAPQSNELLYNKIAPLYSNASGETYAILDNPLLDLLNVKYILTTHYLPNPSWVEIYRDDAIAVYENREWMARAFIASEARVMPAPGQPLPETSLQDVVFIEQTPTEEHALIPSSPQLKEAHVSRYTANDVFIDVNLSDRGWLVLGDAYFPGWKAFLRPFGSDESAETELAIYRANSAFRAVYLPQAGQWTVRFVYTPMSFKLGLYTSFLALMAVLLLLLYWLWGRYYRPESTAGEARTVAKNSLVPMGLNLANKAIDFAFAMLYVRLLGPEGTGQYAFVVAVYGIFEIISRYGLGTLLMRDVSADRNQSSRYLTNVLALRTLLWLGTLPVLALVTLFYWSADRLPLSNVELTSISVQEVQALAILAFSMLFANWADALSSSFSAFEKMEYPAGLASAVALFKVALGALVLLAGWGFVGLAAVSLLANILQVIWLYRLLRITLFQPQWLWDWPLQRWMFADSGALMINHLLATIFWRIDLWILYPLAGEASVGLYSVGLKYLDGLNIIPSVFTIAVFPLMSRYARRDANTLLRSYRLSLRLLVIVSLPLAMAITFLATPLVYLVGGAKYLNIDESLRIFGREIHYLGGSDLALGLIIWSIPIGFVNSVTQYVLIAVNQQRYLTRAFIIGVVFNVVGNLLLIPGMGYVGAALVTILSEFSLLIPFYASVRKHIGVVPWLSIFGQPLVAVLVMGATIYGLLALGVTLWLGVPAGCLAYLLMLLLTGALRGEEMAILGRVLPLKSLRRLLPVGS